MNRGGAGGVCVADAERAEEAQPEDNSQADILASRHKSLNFGAETSKFGVERDQIKRRSVDMGR